MKSHFVSAVAILGIAIAMISAPAEAATTVKSSKSNTSDRVVVSAADEAQCLVDGGTVVRKAGQKICSLPSQ